MEIKEGDILQFGLHFYRVYTTTRTDIVVNKILYNHIKEYLQIFHDYEYVRWDEVGEGKKFTLFASETPNIKAKLELVKRKYKIQKLNLLSED
jgi:hypothetical protein